MTITCPRCGMTSAHPQDVEHGYCGHCHDWTGVDGMANSERYPESVRAVFNGDGFIKSMWIGGPEPLPEGEVEYVRADLHRGAVEALSRYGTHRANCALVVKDDEDVYVECDCGLTAALNAARRGR